MHSNITAKHLPIKHTANKHKCITGYIMLETLITGSLLLYFLVEVQTRMSALLDTRIQNLQTYHLQEALSVHLQGYPKLAQEYPNVQITNTGTSINTSIVASTSTIKQTLSVQNN